VKEGRRRTARLHPRTSGDLSYASPLHTPRSFRAVKARQASPKRTEVLPTFERRTHPPLTRSAVPRRAPTECRPLPCPAPPCTCSPSRSFPRCRSGPGHQRIPPLLLPPRTESHGSRLVLPHHRLAPPPQHPHLAHIIPSPCHTLSSSSISKPRPLHSQPRPRASTSTSQNPPPYQGKPSFFEEN
jgi:hypothetical protein